MSEDEAIREAVATLVPVTRDGRPTSLGTRLANGGERTVRLAVLEQFKEEQESIAGAHQSSGTHGGLAGCTLHLHSVRNLERPDSGLMFVL